MELATIHRFAERLRGEVRRVDEARSRGTSSIPMCSDDSAPFTVPAARYCDPKRCNRERSLFGGPRIVAVSASLERGTCLPIDLPASSLARSASLAPRELPGGSLQGGASHQRVLPTISST